MAKGLQLSDLRGADLSKLSLPQLRQAYTVFRDVLQKRFTRLSESGSATQQAYAKPFMAGGQKELLRLTQIDQYPRNGWSSDSLRREMLMRVREFQTLESSERSSLSGWKAIEKRTIQSLQEHGYHVTKENIGTFGEYMEMMREKFGTKIFPSEEVAELFSSAETGDMSNDEMISVLQSMSGSYGVDLFA